MYVIEVIPMRRGMHRAALSYFSKVPYAPGTLLAIPIRKQEAQGVVITCTEVSQTKSALRSATFSLRKLAPQKRTACLPDSLMQTVNALSEYYAAQPGAVLFALLPNEVRNGNVSIETGDAVRPDDREYSYQILQAPREIRTAAYQSIIRASFAANESVVVVVPTVEDGVYLYDLLKPGIEQHTHFIHSGRGVRTITDIYEKLRASTHATCVIATPQYALTGRADVGTIILERSRAFSYRSQSRPYVDFRTALKVHAQYAAQKLISADTLIRTEDEFLLREDRALPYDEHPNRIALPGTLKLIPMKDKPDGQTPFVLFSDMLLEAIEKVRAARGRTFLFSARRGLAPVVACADCGYIMRCPDSGAPLALHRTYTEGTEERWLVSSVSGLRRRADDLCPSCGSWRLRERGIGIQHVYDELIKHVPQEDVFLFDHQSASTHKKATAIRNDFYGRKKTVLLGTALALPYLHEPVDLSAVVSMDSLRAIPSWRQQEESLGTLLALRERTSDFVFAQSRAEEDSLIEYAQKGTTAAFYTEELSVREQFKYPPYSVFIHLTWKQDPTHQMSAAIAERFAQYGITLYSAPTDTEHTCYGLMRVPRESWPNDGLVDALRALPPSVRIIINPDRIV